MDVPTAAGLALGAAADLALGDSGAATRWPASGRCAAALERRVLAPTPARCGAAYAVALTAAAAGLGVALDRATRAHPAARIAATAAVTWTVLGGTSLGRAAGRMHAALDSGDLDAARRALPALAGATPTPWTPRG